jgi:hypothetical protein
MPKPACLKCQRFYRPKHNGIFVEERMPSFSGAAAGTSQPNSWEPYKLWCADLWECEGCGHQLVSGYAREPVAEHYQQDYNSIVMKLGPIGHINDC